MVKDTRSHAFGHDVSRKFRLQAFTAHEYVHGLTASEYEAVIGGDAQYRAPFLMEGVNKRRERVVLIRGVGFTLC